MLLEQVKVMEGTKDDPFDPCGSPVTTLRAAIFSTVMLVAAMTSCAGQAGPPLGSSPPTGKAVLPVETITRALCCLGTGRRFRTRPAAVRLASHSLSRCRTGQLTDGYQLF